MQKPNYNKESDLIRTYFYKPLFEYPFLKIISKTKITPNQLTIIGMFLGLIVTVLVIIDYNKYLILSGAILVIRNGFDCLDGELARLKRLESDLGGKLDTISDRYTELIISWSIIVNRLLFSNINVSLVIAISLLIVGFGLRYFAKSIRVSVSRKISNKKIQMYFSPLNFISKSVLWRLTIISIGLISNQVVLALFFYALLNILCAVKESFPYQEWWGKRSLGK